MSTCYYIDSVLPKPYKFSKHFEKVIRLVEYLNNKGIRCAMNIETEAQLQFIANIKKGEADERIENIKVSILITVEYNDLKKFIEILRSNEGIKDIEYSRLEYNGEKISWVSITFVDNIQIILHVDINAGYIILKPTHIIWG